MVDLKEQAAPQAVFDLEDGELDRGDPSDAANPTEEDSEASASGATNGLSRTKPTVPDPPPSSPSEDEWHVQGKSAKKKQLKRKVSKGKVIESAVYRSVFGREARPEAVVKHGLPAVSSRDVQALVLSILGDFKEGHSVQWAFVKNGPLVRQVVFLYVPGISFTQFNQRPDLFVNLVKLAKPVKMYVKDPLARPGYALNALLTVPHQKAKRDYLRQTTEGLDDNTTSAGRPFPPAHYVMQPDMMARMNYPMPAKADGGRLEPPEGYLMTRPAGPDASGAPSKPDTLLALDCEMCETAEASELTRISLIDEKRQVLMDELVLPRNAIVDYHTDKSGISEATLLGVNTRLEDVRARFLDLVPANAILVGHALENDLRALRVVHMRCIDTAALFPHPKGLPFRPALRRLAERFLKRHIQIGSHDPIIDASTALDLAELKMKHGPAFGLTSSTVAGEPLAEVLRRVDKPCIFVDRSDTLSRHLSGAATGIPCTSDADVAQKLAHQVQKERTPGTPARFVWGQFRDLATFYEQRASAAGARQAAAASSAQLSNERGTSDSSKDAAHSIRKHGPPEQLEAPVGKRQRTASAVDVSDAAIAGKDPGDGKQQESTDATEAAPGAGMEDGEHETSEEEMQLQRMDRMIGAIHDALPPESVFIVASSQGDTARTRLLYEQKLKRVNRLLSPPWTPTDEAWFRDRVSLVGQHGLCFVSTT